MKIDFVRAEVTRMLNKWKLIRDCIAGQETIKAATTEYLPMPNAHDKSPENVERYKNYVLRASFLNATDNTCQGLIGQVFSADPVVELPPDMELLEEDCDGTGMTLTQRAKKTLMEILGFGRTGLLVDFPKALLDEAGAERDFSRADLNDGTARANILQFDPRDVINWRTTMVGGKSVLSLVVIAMQFISYDDGFEIKTDTEWRVLKLVGGVYVCEVWRKADSVVGQPAPAEPFVMKDTYTPRDATGKPLDFIPFTFVGSLNNNDSADKPPLYDIAVVNIAHYRNSADYEDAVFMTGQGTPVAMGLTKTWVTEVWENKPMPIGARAIVPLPAGGDFKIVAAEENGMVKEAMDQKEKHMAMLGAQLVESKTVQRTLGEAQMERAVIESVLVQSAKNCAAAIQTCLRWAAGFYGADPLAITYELSTDFSITQLTPEQRKATIADYQGGLLTFEEARNQLRQSGIAYLDDAAAKAAIDLEMQTAMDRETEAAKALNDATGGGEDNGNGGAE